MQMFKNHFGSQGILVLKTECDKGIKIYYECMDNLTDWGERLEY